MIWCLKTQEVWTICRIFKRNIAYKRQPQQHQQQAWRQPALSNAPPPLLAESSSNTGSFESDGGGDEYMNCLPVPDTAPGLHRQHRIGSMLNGGGVSVTSSSSFFREGVHTQQFQGQWLSRFPAPAAIEQKPQLLDSSAMTIAFHQNDQSIAGAAAATNDQCYKDGYWDEIAKFMEVNDPTVLYDCRYA